MKYQLTLIAIFISGFSLGQVVPQMRQEDKIRIKEAIHISKTYGDQLWKGYSSVPFAMILITDSTEFLINHPNPSPDFKLAGYDDLLQSNLYYRPAQYNRAFLATFPAVNGLSCIVAGIPENTNQNSVQWVVTLLHEHFHQYQNTYPGYFQSVENLNLSNGDQTGMWMLNYPFPYDSMPVQQCYESFVNALLKTITSSHTKEYKTNLENYFAARKKLKAVLPDADYRYFSFQVWQEGLARYTEYKFLDALAKYQPSKEVQALPDYVSFSELKQKMYKNETASLLNNKLSEAKRDCFYGVGFAEGLLLDRLQPSWPENYLTNKFDIEKYSTKYK
jgi:hypothetical protein